MFENDFHNQSIPVRESAETVKQGNNILFIVQDHSIVCI